MERLVFPRDWESASARREVEDEPGARRSRRGESIGPRLILNELSPSSS